MNVEIIAYAVQKAFCLLNSMNCARLKGVVIPSGFGATTQSKELECKDSECMLIDFTSAVDLSLNTEQKERLQKAKQSNDLTSYNSIYYPIAKEWLENLRKNFKNKRVTLLASDYKLLKYVGVRDITYLCPSQKFLDNHCSRIAQIDPNKISQMRASVMDVIKNKGMKSLIFSGFDDLQNILKDILELRSKI